MKLLVEIILTFGWGSGNTPFQDVCRREDSKSSEEPANREGGSLLTASYVYALLHSAHDDLTPKHFCFFVILPQVDTADAYKHDRAR